ncbi:MAG TPA: hypothetical protein VG839_02030 [Asticcacaulis sp.]|nr:hypothetical protein [Asticcacaulis sp.]
MTDQPSVSIIDYGAVGDGVTDDSAALVAALATNKAVFIPYYNAAGTAPAIWYFNSTQTLAGQVSIEGDKRKPLVKQGAAPLFVLQGMHINIENLMFDQSAQASTSDSTIQLDTANGPLQAICLKNLHFGSDQSLAGNLGGYRSICDTGGTDQVVDLTIADVVLWSSKDTPLYFRNLLAAIFFEKVVVDFTRISTVISYPGIDISGGQGIDMKNVAVQGRGTSGTVNANADGFRIASGAAIDMTLCRADSVGGVGFNFSNLDGCQFISLVGSLCEREQYYLDNVTSSTFVSPFAGGRKGIVGATANMDGFSLNNSFGARVIGLRTIYATGNGVQWNNSSSGLLDGLYAGDNSLLGLKESNGSNYNVFGSGHTHNNGSGNGVTVGSGTKVQNVILFSGTLHDAIGAGSW